MITSQSTYGRWFYRLPTSPSFPTEDHPRTGRAHLSSTLGGVSHFDQEYIGVAFIKFMARQVHNRDISQTLAAADQWIKMCLVEDGSLFSHASLWTAQLVDEVSHAFVEHPDLGEDDFITKLKGQKRAVRTGIRNLTLLGGVVRTWPGLPLGFASPRPLAPRVLRAEKWGFLREWMWSPSRNPGSPSEARPMGRRYVRWHASQAANPSGHFRRSPREPATAARGAKPLRLAPQRSTPPRTRTSAKAVPKIAS
jgi:hypothetical protein